MPRASSCISPLSCALIKQYGMERITETPTGFCVNRRRANGSQVHSLAEAKIGPQRMGGTVGRVETIKSLRGPSGCAPPHRHCSSAPPCLLLSDFARAFFSVGSLLGSSGADA
jgi:hypothetical protein